MTWYSHPNPAPICISIIYAILHYITYRIYSLLSWLDFAKRNFTNTQNWRVCGYFSAFIDDFSLSIPDKTIFDSFWSCNGLFVPVAYNELHQSNLSILVTQELISISILIKLIHIMKKIHDFYSKGGCLGSLSYWLSWPIWSQEFRTIYPWT